MSQLPAHNSAPQSNIEIQPFWDATTEGKLLLKKCNACGEIHYYPRSICPFCFSDDTVWIEASGKGIIYSYSVIRRAEVPYVIAYVTLQEGPTMMTNIINCDIDSVRIDMAVTVSFVDTGEGTALPMFTPA
ncbi:MAG: Zn-ribbon domain-containing OB-fold protein [Cycloclasticus sp.]|nr:Zn-ribbon domain-containing OB-fold protein [Cycloclasticus sp.]